MACPWFEPVTPAETAPTAGRPRPPLGRLWDGRCAAASTLTAAPPDMVGEGCNFGYAACSRRPSDSASAVRFVIVGDRDGCVVLRWSLERDCLPVEHGEATYHRVSGRWEGVAQDSTLARQALAYITDYLAAAPGAGDDVVNGARGCS